IRREISWRPCNGIGLPQAAPKWFCASMAEWWPMIGCCNSWPTCWTWWSIGRRFWKPPHLAPPISRDLRAVSVLRQTILCGHRRTCANTNLAWTRKLERTSTKAGVMLLGGLREALVWGQSENSIGELWLFKFGSHRPGESTRGLARRAGGPL